MESDRARLIRETARRLHEEREGTLVRIGRQASAASDGAYEVLWRTTAAGIIVVGTLLAVKHLLGL